MTDDEIAESAFRMAVGESAVRSQHRRELETRYLRKCHSARRQAAEPQATVARLYDQSLVKMRQEWQRVNELYSPRHAHVRVPEGTLAELTARLSTPKVRAV